MKTLLVAVVALMAGAPAMAQYYPAPQPYYNTPPQPYYVPPPALAPYYEPYYGGGRGYWNRDGNWIPSPTDPHNGLPPVGFTAPCADGTYSFSQHRSGTCSHHGGIAR